MDRDRQAFETPAQQDFNFGGNSPESTTPRRLMVTLVDLSESMNYPSPAEALAAISSGARPVAKRGEYMPIDELNDALRSFLINDVQSDGQLRENGELAVGGFWGENNLHWMNLGVPVREQSPIYWARYVSEYRREQEASKPLQLTAQGGTPLGFAINEALKVVEARTAEWQTRGKRRDHRPIITVLTDGSPTDMYHPTSKNLRPHFSAVMQKVHALEDNNDLLFWIACAGDDADLQMLLPLADKGNLISLQGRKISSFISLMVASLKGASSSHHKPASETYRDVKVLWAKMES